MGVYVLKNKLSFISILYIIFKGVITNKKEAPAPIVILYKAVNIFFYNIHVNLIF